MFIYIKIDFILNSNGKRKFMSKFPYKLLSGMYEGNVNFSSILHIPALTATLEHTVSEDFQDFLEDAYNKCISDDLAAQCPAIKGVLAKIRSDKHTAEDAGEIVQNFYNECGELEFLIKLSIREPCNFKFNDKGETTSNSLSSEYVIQWVLAKDMEHAATIAIERAKIVRETILVKERTEKGFASPQIKEINQLKPAEVVRDQYGYWSHPEYTKYWDEVIGKGAEHCTTEQWNALERELNIETIRKSLELEDSKVWQKYVESSDASDWQPVKPNGDWFLVSIFCNEDGAFATWAKEKTA